MRAQVTGLATTIKSADGRYCTATAKLMHTACGFETKDDYFVGKAKCINVGDARERRACLSELRQAKTEADNECRQVFDARRALCAKVGEGRYDPPFVPENFDTDFRNPSRPNPYYPLASATAGNTQAATSAASCRCSTRPSLSPVSPASSCATRSTSAAC